MVCPEADQMRSDCPATDMRALFGFVNHGVWARGELSTPPILASEQAGNALSFHKFQFHLEESLLNGRVLFVRLLR